MTELIVFEPVGDFKILASSNKDSLGRSLLEGIGKRRRDLIVRRINTRIPFCVEIRKGTLCIISFGGSACFFAAMLFPKTKEKDEIKRVLFRELAERLECSTSERPYRDMRSLMDVFGLLARIADFEILTQEKEWHREAIIDRAAYHNAVSAIVFALVWIKNFGSSSQVSFKPFRGNVYLGFEVICRLDREKFACRNEEDNNLLCELEGLSFSAINDECCAFRFISTTVDPSMIGFKTERKAVRGRVVKASDGRIIGNHKNKNQE